MNGPPQSILIVEDSLDDLFILKRAFRLAGISSALHHVEDGQQAIDYFKGASPYHDRTVHPVPAFVLLDLKLPAKNGFEVLAWIREQVSLRSIVVVVLTSSSEDKDITRAYDLGANAFLVKPTSAEKMTEIVKALDCFWLKQNKFASSRSMPPNGAMLSSRYEACL
jgi:CheY-like chemotaxis protein